MQYPIPDNMHKFIRSFFPILWAALTTVFVLPFFVFKGDKILIEFSGDGLKNYYSFIWHSVNDKDLFWFNGMNYPFGEHIVYTDGEPLISSFLVFLKQYLHLNIGYSEALYIFHITIAFSFFLGIVYTFKVLKHFKVHYIIATVFASLIVTLSPQFFRLEGHFALGQMFVIPMLFFFSLRYNDNRQSKYLIYMFLLGIMSALLHPYYIAIFALWLGLYAIGSLIFKKENKKNKIRLAVSVLSCLVLVIVTFKVFMSITDPITDRPEYPWGTLSACSVIEDIITSPHSGMWIDLHKLIPIDNISKGGEGLIYIGIVSIAVILIAVIYALICIGKKNRRQILWQDIGDYSVWIFIAFGAFLLAQGVPFVWGMEWLLDYVSVFRQFRSLGRFGWVFYNIIAVLSVVAIYRYSIKLKNNNKTFYAVTILLLSIILWSYEGSGHIREMRTKQDESLAKYMYFMFNQSWNDILSDHGYQKEDIQGIIVLPYIHVGSEKIWLNGEHSWNLTMGFAAALQLQKPVVDVLMSRSSWSQTFKQVKVVGSLYAYSHLFDSSKNDKPYLIIHFNEVPLSEDAKYLLENSISLGSYGQADVYICYPKRIRETRNKTLNEVRTFVVSNSNSITDINLDSNSFYFINHYDEGNSKEVFVGAGASKCISGADSIIAEFAIDRVEQDSIYECSLWLLVNSTDYVAPRLYINMYDEQGARIKYHELLPTHSTDNKGYWWRVSDYIEVPRATRRLNVLIQNVDPPSYIALDELLFRHRSDTIITKYKDQILINNHLMPKK